MESAPCLLSRLLRCMDRPSEYSTSVVRLFRSFYVCLSYLYVIGLMFRYPSVQHYHSSSHLPFPFPPLSLTTISFIFFSFQLITVSLVRTNISLFLPHSPLFSPTVYPSLSSSIHYLSIIVSLSTNTFILSVHSILPIHSFTVKRWANCRYILFSQYNWHLDVGPLSGIHDQSDSFLLH